MPVPTADHRHDAQIAAIAQLLGYRVQGLDTILRFAVLRGFVFTRHVYEPLDVLRALVSEFSVVTGQSHLLESAAAPPAPLPTITPEDAEQARLEQLRAKLAVPPSDEATPAEVAARTAAMRDLVALETAHAEREHARRQGIVQRQADIAKHGFGAVRVLEGARTEELRPTE